MVIESELLVNYFRIFRYVSSFIGPNFKEKKKQNKNLDKYFEAHEHFDQTGCTVYI